MTPTSDSPPASSATEARSFDVTEADFRQTVLERSFEVPVLLDCWAPWCGPCRSLKPILEKLAQTYDGRFVLAKLNTDEAPQVSAALQIRSIPLVVLFVDGRPVDQFAGAQPESQIRAFLDRHLTLPVSAAETLRLEAVEADAPAAEALLREALSLEPDNVSVKLDLAERLMEREGRDEAKRLLDAVAVEHRNARHAALQARLDLTAKRPPGDANAFKQRIATHPGDLDARFALAALSAYEGDFSGAFEQLLEVVLRDKGDWRERARKQLVEWFDLCPDAEAVSRARRYLGMYLN